MKITITIIMLFMVHLGFAQITIKKSSIDSGGASVASGNISMTYTIGEVAVQESSSGTIHISEGFLSSEFKIALGVKNYSPLQEVRIFPNPTVNYVNIYLPSQSNYNITIINMKGVKLAEHKIIDSDEYSLDMSGYQNGVYLILVEDISKQSSKVYKIVKE